MANRYHLIPKTFNLKPPKQNNMKAIYNKLIAGCFALTLSAGFTACTDYLDKTADSTLEESDSYKNFTNFQGFVEEIYNCIPDKDNCNWNVSINFGDDELMDTQNSGMLTSQIDLGNFWAWQTAGANWFYQGGNNPTSKERFDHSIWGHAWYCIRKCNIGLQNIDQMTEATTEERNLILGQLYFFRAWWHFQVMEYLGGIPYIDEVMSGDYTKRNRLSFAEAADRCAEDFRRAADLLPIDWDNTAAGKNTLGHNEFRINKITALGYLGKAYLWAASPLINEGAQLNAGDKTYSYNQTYVMQAANAFGELLTYVENGETQYALAEFNYSDVFKHARANNANTCYTDNFYTTGQNWKMPGTTESIMRCSDAGVNASNWGFDRSFAPISVTGGGLVRSATANYVNYAYGMANGLPLDDPDSGFDPTHPFKDRDPRFYHDIVYDGVNYISGNVPSGMADYQYANLYTGGNWRGDASFSRTGYLYHKLAPMFTSGTDTDLWGLAVTCALSYMRLADIYLMYAEACAAVGNGNIKSSNCSLTAADAINKLRDRVGAGEVASKFVGDSHKFMDEVRRERAAELAFEGFRFVDLRRWLLLTENKYADKTAQEFTRVNDLSWYKNSNNDPSQAEVKGWGETTVVTRNYTARNYWFPFFKKDVSIYEGFEQNPGW